MYVHSTALIVPFDKGFFGFAAAVKKSIFYMEVKSNGKQMGLYF